MTADANDIREGSRVKWPAGRLSGYVAKIDHGRAHVTFEDGSTQIFSLSASVLERARFAPGSSVMRADGTIGVVLAEVQGQSFPTWSVAYADGSLANAVEMTLRPATLRDPLARFKANQIDRAEEFNLRAVTADLWTRHLHDPFASLSNARVDLKPHQVSVVHRVVSSYPHRFLLCDEVGLGKTIEAAMILKELRARGLAKRILILVPSGLVRQWQFELKTKFNETFAIFDSGTIHYLRGKGVPNPWTDHDSIIVSESWASYSPERRSEIASVDWDLVIVDEAHHARRQRYGTSTVETNFYRLVYELTGRPEFARRAVLFLTATPMQLQRHELFSLVEMLDPVLFSSEEDFVQHVDQLAGLNRLVERIESRQPYKPDEMDDAVSDVARFLKVSHEAGRELLGEPAQLADRLRQEHRLSEVLLRNRRAVIGGFLPRRAFRWEVELSTAELSVQAKMDSIISDGYQQATASQQNAIGFLMVMWQKLLASSSRALLRSLVGRKSRLTSGTTDSSISPDEAEDELNQDVESMEVTPRLAPAIHDEVRRLDEIIRLLQQIPIDSKAQALLDHLKELAAVDRDVKVIVFTEFRETQDMLAELMRQHGWSSHIFHGQLDPLSKDRAVQRFKDGIGPNVLISTEAGGEGRNFQFAHLLVNYDLPWNPMRIEQRIGRVDRIGQEHPVTIFNFHVIGTIEGRILDVLEHRIRLFEDSIGGLDPILGEAEADIRNALKLTDEAREHAIERVGVTLEAKVETARQAEKQLRDFILDTRSFAAEIAQMAQQQQESVNHRDFARFLVQLLRSANTWVDDGDLFSERAIQFHPPFTEEHKELIGDLEKRRVCFDPRVSVDSEHVEYLGFGHPIIDALVRRVLDEKVEGATTVRDISPADIEEIRPGWQFNWMLKIGGINATEFLYPVFIDDELVPDDSLGASLLLLSRRFQREESKALSTQANYIDTAFQAAEHAVDIHMKSLVTTLQSQAADRYSIEQDRIERLYEHRKKAAIERIRACEQTLSRLRESQDPLQRQVIPLWEANLERARREDVNREVDKARALQDLATRNNLQAEYRLLSVARIESRIEEVHV